MAIKAKIRLLLFIFLSSLSAENPKFSFDKLKEHSTIGFLGDSITQGACKTKNGGAWTDDMDQSRADIGGLYHQYIQLFLSLRYPGKDIWTVNLGHAGAKSDGAIKRLDYDVFPYQLDNILVHFGMNDFRYFLYLEKKTTPNEKRREAMRSEYVKNMTSLVDQLQKNGSKVALLSPSIYDEFQKSAQKTATGAQAELLKYSELAEQLALTENLSFVNLSQPMLEETVKQQKKNPRWSFTNDRVHPAEKFGGGQFMAFHILKNLGASGLVYNLELNAEGKVQKCENAKVSRISKEPNGLRFSLYENSLPFPLLKSDYGFSKLVPFQQELNSQIIKVKDLEEGVYIISIDGTEVGKFSSKDLSTGVNLSGNQNTPQFKLAMSVRDKVLFRKAVLEQRVRVVRNNLRFVLKEIKDIDWSEPNSILAGIERFKKLKAKRGEKVQGWQSYLISTADYTLPRFQETVEELKSIRSELGKLPKEKVYEYLIKKVD